MMFVIEVEVERADGKRDLPRDRVQDELETDVLNIVGDSFYPTTEAGAEHPYLISSVVFREITKPPRRPRRERDAAHSVE